MGSNEIPFNVSLILRDKATKQCPQTTTFAEKGELMRIRTIVPLLASQLLGQTGSLQSLVLQPLHLLGRFYGERRQRETERRFG